MIIDSSYFINDIAIPNVNNDITLAALNSAIDKYEKEALLEMMGYELYELFINNQTDPIYKSILDGAEFTFEFCGKTVKRKWVGLANAEKISLLAYYVYFNYQKDRNTFNTSVGIVTPNVENAEQDNPRLKFVNAWNEYIFQRGNFEKVNKCPNRNRSHRERYFDKYDLSTYEFLNDDPSLFNYLLANVAQYPTWEFTPVREVNTFDL